MTTILVAVVYYAIWLIAIVAALLLLGVPSAVVLTSVGVAFVILAFSLQQSLRDLAAAVLFMIFKPFRLGDLIETNGTTGTVQDIGPFTTTLATWDGKTVVWPNSQVQQAGITNYSTRPHLVTDLKVRIPFGQDPQQARTLIAQMLAEDPRVLTEPAPHIPVLDENDSWILLNVRAGVLQGDYWDLQDSLREAIRIRLDQAGMTVPYPRRDVHLAPAAHPAVSEPRPRPRPRHTQRW